MNQATIQRLISLAVTLFAGLFQTQTLRAVDIEGSSSGVFVNPVPQSEGVVSGVGTSFFTWGIGASGSPPSSLSFTDATFAADLEENFSFGTLSFFNGTIFANTGADSVDLEVTIVFTMPSGVTEEITQTLTLINTLNTSDPIESADLVLLPTSNPEIIFTVNGVEHTLEIIGFGSIDGQGGATTIDRFFVLEGGTASAELLGRMTVCPDPGFQITEREVPGTGKKLCYKFNMSEISDSGNFSVSLSLRNQNDEDIELAVCMMGNANGDLVEHPIWTASTSGGAWTCTDIGETTDWTPSFHFGCREFEIQAGGIAHWFDQGTLPPSSPRLSPYVDFLRNLPVADSCQSGVRGENQFLVPNAPRSDYVNIWALMDPLQELSPSLGCSIEWPVGNWFTMGNPDTYLARLNGTIIDAPTGSVVTLHFPPGSPQLEQMFVVTPDNPNNPTCLGLPLEISVPFVIPAEPSSISLDIEVPEECSELPEGSTVRFLGEAVGDLGSPVFEPDEFIVAHAGTCVVDNTPPQVEQLSLTPLANGFLEIRVEATDEVTIPLAAFAHFQVDGGPEQQIFMGFDDPPVFESTVFFRQIIGPFFVGSSIEVAAEVFDDAGSSGTSPISMLTLLAFDIKPESCPNPLNLNGQGVLPVAILGSETHDVNDIDPDSLALEGIPPLRTNIEDVASPSVDEAETCDCVTDGPDGILDLTLKFKHQEILAAIGPVNPGDQVVLTLTGNLLDGTPIVGTDCVVIVPPGD